MKKKKPCSVDAFLGNIVAKMERAGIPIAQETPKLEKLAEMVEAMLYNDDLFLILRGEYARQLLPPARVDMGAEIREARERGLLPKVEIIVEAVN